MTPSHLLSTAMMAAIAWLPTTSHATAEDRLVIYDIPQKALYTHHNDDFTVRARVPGGAWRDLYEYIVQVDLDNPQNASLVMFDMAGPVEIAVTRNNGDVRRVAIRPDSAGLTARLVGNTAFFTIARPTNISVEFDGDRLHNLHLFASPIETARPDPADPAVVYFGPGIHSPPEGTTSFRIASNKTVYLAGGAILQGGIEVRDATNVRILGRGIIGGIVGGAQEGITIAMSTNVSVDGPVVINPKHYSLLCGQSSHLTVRNFKSFSSGSWTDGLDFMSCSDVMVDSVFMRNSDDTIAIYGHRWDYRGDARNYLISNSVLWADIAHPINIGLHGDDKNPGVIENLVFRNIDVLGHDEDDRNYQGVMAITDGDNNLVRNILFEDIRIDSIEEGMIFNFRAVFNEKYGLAPGRGIERVVVRNVSFKGGEINRPVIAGYSADRMVRDIVIENLRVAGRPLTRSDIDIGPFVESVNVTP